MASILYLLKLNFSNVVNPNPPNTKYNIPSHTNCCSLISRKIFDKKAIPNKKKAISVINLLDEVPPSTSVKTRFQKFPHLPAITIFL